jgi:hypothetical protein
MDVKPKLVLTSVKLYPRLAVPKRTKSQPPRRILDRSHSPATSGDTRDARRSQVRARLLRMILDNEEGRRNDRRPSAS